jgi:hypothetical protein
MNAGMLKMMLGSLGIDGAKIEEQVLKVVADVHYMQVEIAAQGAMIRSICHRLELPVIAVVEPQKEIEHGDG